MTINQGGWKPTSPEAGQGETGTFTGNRALMLEEPLLFEIGGAEQTGVDFSPLPYRGEGRLHSSQGEGQSRADCPSPGFASLNHPLP